MAAAKLNTSKSSPSDPKEGEVWAIPVPKMGFCAVVVARVSSKQAEVKWALVYLRPELSEGLPKPSAIAPLGRWTTAWIGMVPLTPFRNGRWKRCGIIESFDRELWPMPPSRRTNVNESTPQNEWAAHPGGELWSIETTTDEPGMTVIDNAGSTREEALEFPAVDVVMAASRLEKALVNFFKKRRPSFWDMDLRVDRVSPDRLHKWTRHAMKARARGESTAQSWWPAGSKTDRTTPLGAWLGLPVAGGGFGAAILIDRPDKSVRVFSDTVVMAMRRVWEHWPTMEDVRGLRAEDGAMVSQMSFICVRDGRWRVIGVDPAFTKDDWPWPIPWHQTREDAREGVVTVDGRGTSTKRVRLDPKTLALDPYAGRRCAGSGSYSIFETGVPEVLHGTYHGLKDDPEHGFCGNAVSPSRISAWKLINAAILDAMKQ